MVICRTRRTLCTRSMRLLMARCFIYLAFIAVVTLCFIWLFGGFRVSNPAKFRLNSANRTSLSALSNYCKLRHDRASTEEGLLPLNRYKLLSLFVVTRHGDRAPLLSLPAQYAIPSCATNNPSDHAAFEAFRVAMNMNRNQLNVAKLLQRFPLVARTAHQCIEGDLTSVGVVQMIRLGVYLREVYAKWQLLNEDWTVRDLNLTTTVYARTFQSAVAFLYGFLPQFHLSRVRLKASPTTHFCTGGRCTRCASKLASARMTMYQSMDMDMKSYNAAERRVVKHVVQQVEWLVGNHAERLDWTQVFDALVAYVCHDVPLPCVMGNKATKDDMCTTQDAVALLYDLVASRARNTAETQTSARVTSVIEALPFMDRLADAFERASAGHSISKLHYFSGHDITLRPWLHVFRAWQGFIPPYASRLVVELYQRIRTKDGSKLSERELVFRVLYNGRDISKLQPYCRMTDDGVTLCPVEEFLTFLREDYFQTAGANIRTFSDLCLSP